MTAQQRADLHDGSKNSAVDFTFQSIREEIWVANILQLMQDYSANSVVLICGGLHALSVGRRFRDIGFDVEVEDFFDDEDTRRICARDKSSGLPIEVLALCG